MYDNDCFILHSFQPWYDEVRIELRNGYFALEDLVTGRVIEGQRQGDKLVVTLRLSPGVNRVFKMIK